MIQVLDGPQLRTSSCPYFRVLRMDAIDFGTGNTACLPAVPERRDLFCQAKVIEPGLSYGVFYWQKARLPSATH